MTRPAVELPAPDPWETAMQNKGLVWFEINRRRWDNYADRDEAFQDGITKLVRAAELFDPGKGFKFSTYALGWVRQGISEGIAGRAGANARRAARAGTTYEPPVPLASPATPGGDQTVEDTLPAFGDNPEHTAVCRAAVGAALTHLRAAAVTPVDHALIDVMAGYEWPSPVEIAADMGVGVSHVAYRLQRLTRIARAARDRGVLTAV